MNENLIKLIEVVLLVNPEAGQKLRNHFIKALLCDAYAKHIGFKPNLIGGLAVVFLWGNTSEGFAYWAQISRGVSKRNFHLNITSKKGRQNGIR